MNTCPLIQHCNCFKHFKYTFAPFDTLWNVLIHMYTMSCSELFSFFRGLRILLKTQGSLWDPDKSIYNTCTSDPPHTQSKCHVTHLKCRAVLRVQAQHVWTHQWSFQSCTVSHALLFPCWSDERWKHYRLEYSVVEQTSLFTDPCERRGDKYLRAEPYLEVVAVVEFSNSLSEFFLFGYDNKRALRLSENDYSFTLKQ